MTYEDTHVTPLQLARLNPSDFDMAMIQDSTAKPMRTLFSIDAPASRYPLGRTRWRRLVIHVADINAPDLSKLLLNALGLTTEEAEL